MQINEEELKHVARQIGERIQQLRKAAELTQTQLEQRAEVYDVGAIERGETNPTLLTLLRLAMGLGVELKEVLENVRMLSAEDETKHEIEGLLAQQDEELRQKILKMIRVLVGKV